MSRTTTLEEIRKWPALVGVEKASVDALHISRSYGFELARLGKYPCKVIKVGSRYRVVTSSLIALLETDEDVTGGSPPAA
jgi:hypothetical protein